MPVTRSQIPKMLTPGMNAKFMQGYKAVTPKHSLIAVEVQSTKDKETYPWLGASPMPKETPEKGVIERGGLREFSFEIENKKYAGGIILSGEAIEDDQYGMLVQRASQLGTAYAKYEDVLLAAIMDGAFSTTCYDGQYMCDTDHSDFADQTDQSNKLTAALSAAALEEAIYTMQGFKDDRDNVIGIEPTHLVVHPKNQFKARELLQSTYHVDTATANISSAVNPLQGMLELIVFPHLTNQDYWFVVSREAGLSPFVHQRRTPAALRGPTWDDNIDAWKWTIRGRGRFGYSDWRYVIGSDGTT